MKKLLVVAAFILVPCAAKAQWTVIDPAEIAQTVKLVSQAGQTWNFINQQIQQLENMPNRYRGMFGNWNNIWRSVDMYGNASGWNSAVNSGTVGTGYSSATNTMTSYSPGTWAAQTADIQQRIMSKVATIELMDAANPNAIQMIGQIRANGSYTDSQLGNLDTDTLGGMFPTQTQVAQQQATASVTLAHLQSDANKLMLSQTETLLLQAKQQRDDQVAGLAADANYRANVANTISSGSTGLGESMDGSN